MGHAQAPVLIDCAAMGVLSRFRDRLGRAAENWRQSMASARVDAERKALEKRLDTERKALQKYPEGPFAFLTITSKGDAEFYLNRGWQLVNFKPGREVKVDKNSSYMEADEWHLKTYRQVLSERLEKAAELPEA
jgi:hypothetical protein